MASESELLSTRIRAGNSARRALVVSTLLAAACGASLGNFLRVDFPGLGGLEDRAPAQMTRILAADGAALATFGTEKRILVEPGGIPESFRLALIASEDSRFESHFGIDPRGGFRSLFQSLRDGRPSQGASTLTMQLAGMLFLDRSQRTVQRKLQEALLAFEIERRYSKPEILRMYVNQVHFGHGLYGLEAASRYYFGKPAAVLNVAESATLVGVLPRPADYSPFRNPVRAVERRGLVLRRMVIEGYLSPAEARRHAAAPLALADRAPLREPAPYFREAVRRRLDARYGRDALYRGGLVVRTTLDPRLQTIASRAVDRGLRALDKRRGWRADAVRRLGSGEEPEVWTSPAWSPAPTAGTVTDGVVLEADEKRALVRIDSRVEQLDGSAIAWTGELRPDRLLRRGDVIRVRLPGSAGASAARLELEQEPEVEAALVAIEPATGALRALVGGFDFARSEFDRALQARRQPGSLFKPFVYAAALAGGHTLADTVVDEPTVFLDPRRPVPYQPENFSRRYHETLTLRTALEASVNIATVKLLDRTGYDAVIDTARALGIESPLRPYPSLALGAFELTLLEVTSAYAAFANQGLRVEPHLIDEVADPLGRTLHRARPQVDEAVSPQLAYLMNQALSGVIRRGTGRSAASMNHPLAGKTGTTDDSTDAWFVGYAPRLAVGVWVGYDEPRSLGAFETGARAALPIWIEFMREALAELDGPEQTFVRPPGIVTARIDPSSGLLAHAFAGCSEGRIEFFREGSEPTRHCSRAIHRLLRLPAPFQRHPLDADGALRIPVDELERLVAAEPAVSFDRSRNVLESLDPDGIVRLSVVPLPAGRPARPLPDGLRAESLRGTDGRAAAVIWLDGRARSR